MPEPTFSPNRGNRLPTGVRANGHRLTGGATVAVDGSRFRAVSAAFSMLPHAGTIPPKGEFSHSLGGEPTFASPVLNG